MKSHGALTGLALAVLLLAGCGSTGSGVETEEGDTSSQTSATQSATASSTSGSAGTSTAEAAASTHTFRIPKPPKKTEALPKEELGVLAFQSPSGNIKCGFVSIADAEIPLHTSCMMSEADWENAFPRPECDVDWVPTDVDLAEKVSIGDCRGDVSLLQLAHYDSAREAAVLEYGEDIWLRNYGCRSEKTGMTCWNSDSRNGFTISKSGVTVFTDAK